MRWTLRISFALFLAWLVFLASPFLALYDLVKAVEAKDPAWISARVNFNAVRVSLSRQIVGAFADQRDLGGLDRDVAVEAGAAALNPVLEDLVTPQALADLLQNGWPRQIPAGPNAPSSPLAVDLGSIGTAWRVFIFSESQGFRSITIPLPIDQPKEKQFRLTLRLSGTTWRLTGIDLPKSLRDTLVRRSSRAISKREGK